MADIFNPRTLEAEEGGSLLVLGHLGLHSEYKTVRDVSRDHISIYIFIYNNKYIYIVCIMKTFSRKRTNDSLSFTDAWRELEDIMLNEISQI